MRSERLQNKTLGLGMRCYWWNDVPNFGDAISPLLLKKFSNIDVTYSNFPNAEIIVSGSVIHHMPAGWEGTVIGAGLLRADLPLKNNSARILAVRGPLTAQLLGVSNVAIGDAGLLADELLDIMPSKKWDLGIVPHWTDEALENDPRFNGPSVPYTVKVINASDDPMTVINQIGSCRRIVTSSLHGMIVADSFGIPRRFETTPLFDLDTLFKFHDYSASIGLPLEAGVVQTASINKVNALKHELFDVFESLIV